MGELQKLAGLPLVLGLALLPLLGIADLIEFDSDDTVVRSVERRPDKSLPAKADLLEQLVLQELVARVEFAEAHG